MRLAIVIPTLDEEKVLEACLEAARRSSDLVVVSDGGSSDGTCALARRLGAVVIVGEAGRGRQLNSGARTALARGADALLFVHADTVLPDDAGEAVAAALSRGAVGGGFPVALENPRGFLRLAAGLINLRTRRFKIALGDQAQFVHAPVFEALGGYRDWPILEDLDLILRLRRVGPVAIPERRVRQDPRRFVELGTLRTVLLNWLIFVLFFLGVDPHRLARLYRKVR